MTSWLSPLTGPLRVSTSIAADAARAARSWAVSHGRGRRRVWSREGRAHIEVRAVGDPGREVLVKDVEDALEASPGVRWAQVNPVTGRAVAAFDEGRTAVEDLVGVIEATERAHDVAEVQFPLNRPEYPSDLEPIRRALSAVVADAAGLGLGVFGVVLRSTPLPVELASLITLVDTQPRLRHLLESRLGGPATDLGLAVGNALAQGLAQGPLGLAVDLAYRQILVGEARARRQSWESREAELWKEPLSTRPALAEAPRPVALSKGQFDTYADRATIASVGAAGLTLGLIGDPRPALAMLGAGAPKAARIGQQVYAAEVAKALARRGVVVLDPGVLRRLDRVDSVVIEEDLVLTDSYGLGKVITLAGEDEGRVHRHLAELFDPADPFRMRRGRGWALAPLSATRARDPRLRESVDGIQLQPGRTLALLFEGKTRAVATVVEQVDEAAKALVGAAREAGHMVALAGERPELVEELRADMRVAGGSKLGESVRMLQADGCGVLLVSRPDRALASADCGIEVHGGAGVAATGHLISSNGLADAAFVLRAAGSARGVARQSVGLSMAGSSLGGLVALMGIPGRAGARAMTPVNLAALASLVLSARSARRSAARSDETASDVPPVAPPWHRMTPAEVVELLDSSRGGLSPEEAAKRRAEPEVPAPSLWRALREELANPLTPVLGAGAAASAAVGSVADAVMVAAVSGFNSVLGGAQRYQAERSIAALMEKTDQPVSVVRQGTVSDVDADEVVEGDIVSLESGDAVPADCRILDADNLQVDESSLTGESVLVDKSAEPSFSPVVAERASMLYEGSYVAAGTALAVVVGTGENTEMGRTEREAGPSRAATGVEARLHQLTRWALPASAVGGGAVVATGVLRGRGIRDAVGTGVSLAVAAVPEGLPLLTTMAQLAAARRLSARGALVRNPRAIEALGRVNVLCVDKTGTLTKGKIHLVRVSDGRSERRVGEESLSQGHRGVLAAALRASPPFRSGDVLPHPTDAAVVEGVGLLGIPPDDGRPDWERADELPFEPARGYHAVLGTSDGRTFLSIKGAPEIVLPKCARWGVSGELRKVDSRTMRRLEAEVTRLARRGLRVLAVAETEWPGGQPLEDGCVEGLDFLGFVLLADPVRKTAAAAVEGLREAGVEVVMVTGDHPSTAEGIAAELGILDGGRILSGSEMQRMSDAALAEAVGAVSVFARVTPLDKVRIVRAFQEQGLAVAMTGDGANDAPAIRLADAGVAVGKRATPAARQAADVVVTNNKVETIVEAIIEGRGMWASVREALSILLGGNLGEMTFVIGGGLFTGRAPLSARQLLLVNLLTDVAPALAIAVRPPRSQSRHDLVREGPEASLAASLDRAIAVRAATTAAGAGGAWVVGRMTGRQQRASTIALVALVGTQLGQTLWSGGFNPLVAAAGIGSAGVLVGVVQTPGLSQFFGCTPLGPMGWSIAGGSAVAATAANSAVTTFLRRRQDAGLEEAAVPPSLQRLDAYTGDGHRPDGAGAGDRPSSHRVI